MYYYEFLLVFDVAIANTLLLYYEYNYSIELKPSTTLPFSPLYNMLVEEL